MTVRNPADPAWIVRELQEVMEDPSLAKVEPLHQDCSLLEVILIRDTAQLLDRRQVATNMTKDTDGSKLRKETSLALPVEA